MQKFDQFFTDGITVNHTCGIQQESGFFAVGFTDLFAANYRPQATKRQPRCGHPAPEDVEP